MFFKIANELPKLLWAFLLGPSPHLDLGLYDEAPPPESTPNNPLWEGGREECLYT